MSKTPESCLGNLIKDIDEEVNPDDYYSISKDSLSKVLKDQKSSLDSMYTFNSLSTATSSLNYQIKKSSILSAFNSQHDTILLQKMLKECSKEILEQIIQEMLGTFSIIIKNKNGNYFFSDLFKSCDEKERIIVLKELSLTLAEDCLDDFGTHSIQTLIEISSCEEEFQLILSSFNDCSKILKAAINSNGFYVIQKIINHIPEKFRMNFNYLFLKLFHDLSLDIYGISTVKAFIFHTKNEEIMNQIWIITDNNFLEIAKDKYGNYLIQCMLEHWANSKPGVKLKKMIIKYFDELIENHYSKYICDLFINRSNIEEKKFVLALLLKNKHNLNLFKINKDKDKKAKSEKDKIKNFGINNSININNDINNINNNNNINIHIPLSNDAKPFYPKKKLQYKDK